jgi:hypothetical protein
MPSARSTSPMDYQGRSENSSSPHQVETDEECAQDDCDGEVRALSDNVGQHGTDQDTDHGASDPKEALAQLLTSIVGAMTSSVSTATLANSCTGSVDYGRSVWA